MLRLHRAGVLFDDNDLRLFGRLVLPSIFGGKLTSLCYGNLISDFPPVEPFDVLLMSLGVRHNGRKRPKFIFWVKFSVNQLT